MQLKKLPLRNFFFQNYVGRLAPIGDNPYILDDFNHGMPIDYRVDFPTTSPLPKLTSLTVNDNVLCYGHGGKYAQDKII